MAKLFVQIPCHNEAEALPATLRQIPRSIRGINSVEILVIDDGSTDGTAEIALAHGADHVVRNTTRKGVAYSFQRGLDFCLQKGADIIVNTDGDNQYRGEDIAALVAPLIEGRADMVVGDRRTNKIGHFSPIKRLLQRQGSKVVACLAGIDVADAVSGFRAFSAKTARSLVVRSRFSYTTETLIQASKMNLSILFVPIRTNKVERPSRLFRSVPQFVMRSSHNMLRAYFNYEPQRIFGGLGMILLACSLVMLGGPLLGLVPSHEPVYLVVGGVLLLLSGISMMFALLADLIAYNRQVVEATLERVRKIDVELRCHDGSGGSEPAELGKPELPRLRSVG